MCDNEESFVQQQKANTARRNNIARVAIIIVVLASVPLAGYVLYQIFGKSYQVIYEVDLLALVQELAKTKDEQFATIMHEVEKEAVNPNLDFFETMQRQFAAINVDLSRYFGLRSQTDTQIINELREYARDAIDGNIKILHKRLHEIGVHKPSVIQQGTRHIVVEMAGITDVDHVKQIIGRTARLEFNPVKDLSSHHEVIVKIDNFLKRELAKQKGGYVMATDIYSTGDQARENREVSVTQLFGGFSIVTEDSSGKTLDSVLVYKKTFAENPFFSLLRAFHNDVCVPIENFRKVERILNSPEIQNLISTDGEFVWSLKPESVGETEYYFLYLLKKEPELSGAFITDVQALKAQEKWIVNIKLNDEGTKIFSQVTGENIDKRLAIVLDNKVVMVSNIKEKISSGTAEIAGNVSSNEAKDLIILIRTGSLQVPIKVIEVRSVNAFTNS